MSKVPHLVLPTGFKKTVTTVSNYDTKVTMISHSINQSYSICQYSCVSDSTNTF